MRSIGVRYLVRKQLKGKTLWYWEPSAKLRAAGFLPRRLSDQITEAVTQAEALNSEVDRWYLGGEKVAPFAPGSLAHLDTTFQSDDAFRSGMAPRTQRDYCYNIKAALDDFGREQVASITRKVVKDWHRAIRDARGASAARNAAAALRRLMSFAVDEGWLRDNPALKMRIATPGSRARVWAPAERDAFVSAALDAGRPSMALAVMLGWCLGQRPADLRTLAWTAYDGDGMLIRQAKTDARIWVPVLTELRTLLDATPRSGVQIVVSETSGKPYQESDFQHRFADIRAAAGLPDDLQFRDLRRTLATALGAAGCTDDQIRAVTGHKTRAVVAVYVRPDRTFAEGAMRRLKRAQTRTE